MQHELQTCRHCGDAISTSALTNHETRCATATPEDRIIRKVARLAARNKTARNPPAKRGRPPNDAPAPPTVPTKPKRVALNNGNGKRFAVTLSVDFQTLRDLLLQLGPSLSIDKTEVI